METLIVHQAMTNQPTTQLHKLKLRRSNVGMEVSSVFLSSMMEAMIALTKMMNPLIMRRIVLNLSVQMDQTVYQFPMSTMVMIVVQMVPMNQNMTEKNSASSPAMMAVKFHYHL